VPPTFQTTHAGCAEPITLLIRAHPVIGEVVRSAAFPWIAERGRLVALIKQAVMVQRILRHLGLPTDQTTALSALS